MDAFNSQVEAVRTGTIFGMPGGQKQYESWRAKTASKNVGLSGAALERVIMGLAITHPDIVSMRT